MTMTSVVIPVHADGAELRAQLPRLFALRGAKQVIVSGSPAPSGSSRSRGDGDDSGEGERDDLAFARALGAEVVRAPGGRGPQMNAGARRALGERLLFLHADCWLDDGALAEGEELLADPRNGAAVFRQQIEGERLAYRVIETAATFRAAVLRTPYGDSGLLLRRSDFERAGGFPELPLCEDLGFARRLRPLGRIVVARSRVHLSPRRWVEHGVIKTTLLNWWIAAAFIVGVAPQRLYRLYYKRPVPDGGRSMSGSASGATHRATSEEARVGGRK
jgi:rSAM/selenodomain-associated transferase 2